MRLFSVIALVALSLIACKEESGLSGQKIMVPESVRLVQPASGEDANKSALLVFDDARCRYRPIRQPAFAKDGYAEIEVVYQFQGCSDGSPAGALLTASRGVKIKLVSAAELNATEAGIN